MTEQEILAPEHTITEVPDFTPFPDVSDLVYDVVVFSVPTKKGLFMLEYKIQGDKRKFMDLHSTLGLIKVAGNPNTPNPIKEAVLYELMNMTDSNDVYLSDIQKLLEEK